MKRLGINIVRKKQVQASAQLSLAASAAPPDSGFAFVHNSQGASAALSEFSGVLSGALRQIDLEGKYDRRRSCVPSWRGAGGTYR